MPLAASHLPEILWGFPEKIRIQLQIRHNCHIFGLHAQKIQSGMLYTLLRAHTCFLVQVGLVCCRFSAANPGPSHSDDCLWNNRISIIRSARTWLRERAWKGITRHLNFVLRNSILMPQGWPASRPVVFLFQYMGLDKSSGPELETLPADKLVYER